MKKKNNSLNSFIFNTNLYHRLVRYPMFPITPKTESVQNIEKGTAIMKSKDKISAEDAEKLFAIIYMTQKGIIPFETLKAEKFEEKIIFISFPLKEIRKILGSNNDKNIIESIDKLTKTTFIFDLQNYKGKKENNIRLITHPILMSKLNKKNNEITILMEKFFFEVCLEKSLTINLQSYIHLKGLAKNLYLFLCANMDKTTLSYETIRKRCHVEPQVPNYNFRINLKKALTSIQKIGLIKSFTITKNSIQISFSKISNQISFNKTTDTE